MTVAAASVEVSSGVVLAVLPGELGTHHLLLPEPHRRSQDDPSSPPSAPRRSRRVLVLAVVAGACGSSGAGSSATATTGAGGRIGGTVRLLTDTAFAVSKPVLQAFERRTGIKVEVVTAGDGVEVVNKAVLTKSDPEGDVLYGIDNNTLSTAFDNDIFVPYRSPGLSTVDAQYQLDPEHRVTPIDKADVCVDYDVTWFASHHLAPPQSLSDLTDPRYKGLLVTEDPSSSTPGLAFMLATIAATRHPRPGRLAGVLEGAAGQRRRRGQRLDGRVLHGVHRRRRQGDEADRRLLRHRPRLRGHQRQAPSVDVADRRDRQHVLPPDRVRRCARRRPPSGRRPRPGRLPAVDPVPAGHAAPDVRAAGQPRCEAACHLHDLHGTAGPRAEPADRHSSVPSTRRGSSSGRTWWPAEPPRRADRRCATAPSPRCRWRSRCCSSASSSPCRSSPSSCGDCTPVTGWNLDVVARVLRDPNYRKVAWFTLWEATASTVVTLVVALPMAALFAKFDFPAKRVLWALLIVPFVLPTVVVGTAFLAILGPGGSFGVDLQGTIWLILIAHAFFNVAVVVRTVGGLWANLDPGLEEAARTLGASRSARLPRGDAAAPAPGDRRHRRRSCSSSASPRSASCCCSEGCGPGRSRSRSTTRRRGCLQLDVAAVLAILQLVGRHRGVGGVRPLPAAAVRDPRPAGQGRGGPPAAHGRRARLRRRDARLHGAAAREPAGRAGVALLHHRRCQRAVGLAGARARIGRTTRCSCRRSTRS